MNKTLQILIIILCYTSCTQKYTWIAIGDSITWQDGKEYNQGKDEGKKAIGYQSIINSKIDSINIKNKGYSSYPLTGKDKSVFSKVYDINYSNVKLVTIFCGTNDFRLNKEIGAIDKNNCDETTFYGAYNKLIKKILNDNKNTKIVLLTPLQRNKDGYSVYSTNTVGYQLKDYINAIDSVSAFYNLELIDLYNESGININNLEQYTLDGLHPNNEGYQLIANKLMKEIF